MNKSKVTLDIDDLKAITNYCHYIPITRGFHREFFANNYPGWEWNDFVPQLLKRGILVRESKDPSFIKLRQGLCISKKVESIEFTPSTTGVIMRITEYGV